MDYAPRIIVLLLLNTFASVTHAGNPGACVIEHCAAQLAECELDTFCRNWQSCVRGCGISGSLPCQIRCGDLWQPTNASAAKIQHFSECVISNHHCIPRSNATCPVPPKEALVPTFNLTRFEGEWFITRGFNPLYDCFDCQDHHFTVEATDPKPLKGDLRYLVKQNLNCTGGANSTCQYIQREVHQGFAPDPSLHGHLLNHNNTAAELHYADDWYVLSAILEGPDAHALIYYCGCNDAECGYSGAFLYTRTRSFNDLSTAAVSAIRSAAKAAHIPNFSLDSMCSPQVWEGCD